MAQWMKTLAMQTWQPEFNSQLHHDVCAYTHTQKLTLKDQRWLGVRAFATNPDSLNSIPRTHIAGDN